MEPRCGVGGEDALSGGQSKRRGGAHPTSEGARERTDLKKRASVKGGGHCTGTARGRERSGGGCDDRSANDWMRDEIRRKKTRWAACKH
eukprot:519758-Pleurochrysis_carterae.AAC.1